MEDLAGYCTIEGSLEDGPLMVHSEVVGPPVGLTGLDPMPYRQTRWNGSVWPDIQVDSYNRLLADIARKHRAGYDTQSLIDGLYNLAHGFDVAGKPARCACAHNADGSITKMLCPAHADTDPCTTMSQVTGKRRKGSIVRGTCNHCGWKA